MLTSLYVFDIYKDITKLDPARMAAGVITGIEFIGAGTIIRDIGCGFYNIVLFVLRYVENMIFFPNNCTGNTRRGEEPKEVEDVL